MRARQGGQRPHAATPTRQTHLSCSARSRTLTTAAARLTCHSRDRLAVPSSASSGCCQVAPAAHRVECCSRPVQPNARLSSVDPQAARLGGRGGRMHGGGRNARNHTPQFRQTRARLTCGARALVAAPSALRRATTSRACNGRGAAAESSGPSSPLRAVHTRRPGQAFRCAPGASATRCASLRCSGWFNRPPKAGILLAPSRVLRSG